MTFPYSLEAGYTLSGFLEVQRCPLKLTGAVGNILHLFEIPFCCFTAANLIPDTDCPEAQSNRGTVKTWNRENVKPFIEESFRQEALVKSFSKILGVDKSRTWR